MFSEQKHWRNDQSGLQHFPYDIMQTHDIMQTSRGSFKVLSNNPFSKLKFKQHVYLMIWMFAHLKWLQTAMCIDIYVRSYDYLTMLVRIANVLFKYIFLKF